jgi:micrococcal nuclease
MARRETGVVPIELGRTYRARARAQGRARRAPFRALLAAVTGIGIIIGLAVGQLRVLTGSGRAALAAETSPEFAVCGTIRRNCVVDGDTFWLNGVKIRIGDIDTPEISAPGCDAEYTLGIRARDRLIDLLNQGPISLERIGSRDEDQYGRKLRVVVRAGTSLGDLLVAEGLARTWTGRREPWC